MTIAATLGGYLPSGQPASVTAYLTSTLGPGTTVADQISTSTVTLGLYSGKPASYALFSGMNLTPGRYYLTMALTNDAGWLSSSTPNLFEAPGFTYTGAFNVNGTAGAVNAYMPSSDFYPLTDSDSPASYGLIFEVSGIPSSEIPEPSMFGTIVFGSLGLSVAAIRRRRCCPL